MKTEDLKYGNVVETRNGNKYIYNKTDRHFISLDGRDFLLQYLYSDDLKTDNRNRNEFDIIKVYEDYTCQKVLWESKEIALTDDKKVILRNVDKDYKWIARDRNNNLFLYKSKPKKYENSYYMDKGYTSYEFNCFNHLFQFIKWEDEEPTLIEDLLKNESEE